MNKKVSIANKPSPNASVAQADKWVERREIQSSKSSTPMKRLTIDVPVSLHRKLKTACALRGSKMADEIRELLEQHYQDKEE